MFNKVSFKEKLDFTKSLAVMLRSGLAIDDALQSLGRQAKSRHFQKVLGRISEKVKRGTALTKALAPEQRFFGVVYLGLIKTGEASGTLDKSLEFLSGWLEREDDLKRKVSTVTLYPKIVLSATLVLGFVLAFFVLPRLVPLFSRLRIELPWATKAVLGVAVFVENYWLAVLLGFIAVLLAIVLLSRTRFCRQGWHRFVLRIPWVRDFTSEYQLALLAQLMATLSKSGLTLGESLKISSEALTNSVYREALQATRQRVVRGTALAEAMSAYPRLFPSNFVNISAVGERSGTLEDSFRYLGQFYTKEINDKTRRLPSVLEPALLIFIGLVVGFIALAIISPIYQITKGIGQ